MTPHSVCVIRESTENSCLKHTILTNDGCHIQAKNVFSMLFVLGLDCTARISQERIKCINNQNCAQSRLDVCHQGDLIALLILDATLPLPILWQYMKHR